MSCCRVVSIFSLALFTSLCFQAGLRAAEDAGAAQPAGVQGEVASEHEMDAAGSHGDAHGGSSSPIPIAPDLAIFTAIIFLVLLAVLWKFAWGPITEALDRREKGVADQIAAAHRSHEEAKQLLEQHRAQLSGATEEVRALLEQARRDADAQKQQILTEAQAAAQAQKDRALREIDAAKNQALRDLAEKSVDTAVGLAGRIVRRQLKSDDHAELIKEALQQFPSEN